MLPILTPEQMRRADAAAIEQYGVPSLLLMENAARSAADILERRYSEVVRHRTALLLCGSGNNGGDGFALARHLYSRGWRVFLWWVGSRERMSPETAVNFEAARRLGLPITHVGEERSAPLPPPAELLIDALLGVGARLPLRGAIVELLRAVRSLPAHRVALDVPTGLDAETGCADADAFTAELTITMFALKTGLLLNDGQWLCGTVEIASLGVPASIAHEYADTWALEWEDVRQRFPKRWRRSTKFDYGRLGIIAGSASMAGAAALTANAAIRSGAGLVYLYTAGRIHSAVLPEVIARLLPSTPEGWMSPEALPALLELAERVDALVIGPGLGAAALPVLEQLWAQLPERLPVLLDADALRLVTPSSQLRQRVVLTPHVGEFARMTGLERAQIVVNAPWLARQWALQWGCVLLLKHVPTVITDGRRSYWNLGGNPGMATAGSGDVLAGMLGALLARGVEPLEAAALAAFLHSAAGDHYVRSSSMESLTASELIAALPAVLPSELAQ